MTCFLHAVALFLWERPVFMTVKSARPSNDSSTVLSPRKHSACILQCVMLAINQPVGQIDTNQPWPPSRTARLPISEMAATTHRVPSALHFMSKRLYHLSSHLKASVALRHYGICVVEDYVILLKIYRPTVCALDSTVHQWFTNFLYCLMVHSISSRAGNIMTPDLVVFRQTRHLLGYEYMLGWFLSSFI